MNIVESLLNFVALRSGQESKNVFFDRFTHSRFANELAKPILRRQGNRNIHLNNLNEIPYRDLTFLTMTNNSNSPTSITFHEDITNKLDNLEKAFEIFISFSAHSNSLGDFRKYSHFYHYHYCTSNYLFFHGDGNCVTLGILLYSFLEHFYKKNSIELYYCCGLQREFMHVYAQTPAGYHPPTYIDPDQKIFCNLQQLDDMYSPGLIYQLLSGAGFHVYDSISPSIREKLFLKMTHEIMDEYRVLPGPIIYRSDPYKENYSQLFAKSRKDNSERLNILANDYSWKFEYKEIGERFYETAIPFLSKMKESVEIIIPANGSLSIGLSDWHPQEIRNFCMIFFGRIPLSLSCTLRPNKQRFTFPLLPWMILLDLNAHEIEINGIYIKPEITHCKKFKYIGMGQLEEIINLNEPISFSISSAKSSIAHFILPFNGLGINADVIKLNSNAMENLAISCYQ